VTQRLPVAAVPEERLVAPVRHDVIDIRGSRDAAVPIALCTERVLTEPRLACLVPSARVATAPSRRAGRVCCSPGSCTMRVTAAALDESGTTGMRARALGGKWQMTLVTVVTTL
jgi:hypothetical protein